MDRGAWRATVHGGRTGLDMIEATCTAHPLVGLKLKLQHFGHLMQRADSLERPSRWERLNHEEKEATEDNMAGWHHRLNGVGFKQTLGDSEGQGSLVCCSP